MKHYRSIGLGGTFDHFHVGHQHFLQFAAGLADKIFVGVTTPELTLHKEAAEFIEPFEARKESVEKFLSDNHIDGEVFALSDTFGPTLENSKVEAVAVTEHTVQGASLINQKRTELGLEQLPVHICTLLRDVTGQLISSTRIRRGEIDRQGRVYSQLLERGLHPTAEQLSFFKSAQGPVMKVVDPQTLNTPTLIVGDIVSELFIQNGWSFSLAVFDQKSARQDYKSVHLQKQISDNKLFVALTNPAGQLTDEVTHWLAAFCKKLPPKQSDTPTFLKIDGEEDLITVGLVLLAPLGTKIFYGQPNEGMVELEVSEELKERFRTAVGL